MDSAQATSVPPCATVAAVGRNRINRREQVDALLAEDPEISASEVRDKLDAKGAASFRMLLRRAREALSVRDYRESVTEDEVVLTLRLPRGDYERARAKHRRVGAWLRALMRAALGDPEV